MAATRLASTMVASSGYNPRLRRESRYALNHYRIESCSLAGHGARKRRCDRVLRQGHHRQAVVSLRRRCGHGDHVSHAVRIAAVPDAFMVVESWSTKAHGARLENVGRAGVSGLLPGEFF